MAAVSCPFARLKNQVLKTGRSSGCLCAPVSDVPRVRPHPARLHPSTAVSRACFRPRISIPPHPSRPIRSARQHGRACTKGPSLTISLRSSSPQGAERSGRGGVGGLPPNSPLFSAEDAAEQKHLPPRRRLCRPLHRSTATTILQGTA